MGPHFTTRNFPAAPSLSRNNNPFLSPLSPIAAKMGQSKKNAKATKKFEAKHLKGVLEKRKTDAKVKQRAQVKAKKQLKRSKDDEFYKGPQDDTTEATEKKRPGATVSSMSVDDFFGGGFEILDGGKNGKKAGKLGKRKRDEPEEDGASADSASDSDADSDDEDRGMTKGALEALATDDPEFYKYLQENDPEALEYDENVDLAEIDDLSSGEGEDDEQPKKKRK